MRIIIRLKDWMSKPVITIDEKKTILDACKFMARYNIGCLVVAEDHKPKGIITERDVVNRVVSVGKDPSKVLVEEIMTKKVLTVKLDESFLDVSSLMKDNNYRRMVIMDGEQIAGIMTARDLIKIISA